MTSDDLVRSLRDETGYHPATARLHREAADTIERLERELDDLTREHDSWVDATNEEVKARQRLERELAEARLQAQADRSFQVTNQKLKAELAEAQKNCALFESMAVQMQKSEAEARKEAARERGWRKIAQQRLKRANLPEPEWPIDAAKERE